MPKPTILVVNPNTSTTVTDRIIRFTAAEIGDAARLEPVTAEFGHAYISSRVGVAVAGHAVVDSVAKALASGLKPHSILLACFGDPAIEALREMTGLPVVGFASAGLAAAAERPGRFIVATNGAAWLDMLGELAGRLGLIDRVSSFENLEACRNDPIAIHALLTRCMKEDGASNAVVGGAGMIAAIPDVVRLAPDRIIDAHAMAVRQVLQRALDSEAGAQQPGSSSPSPHLSVRAPN